MAIATCAVVGAGIAGLSAAEVLRRRGVTAQVHRWRYGRPTARHTPPRLGSEVCPPLAFAGDAFAGARVAGPHLSRRIAPEAILAAADAP